jgi:SWI/SNF-related matrix-associated actin-dependent regulator of chromatin subfamily A-like protein 1
MRKCSLEAGKLSLSFSYSPDLVNGIKELPPYCRKWNPKEKKWILNLQVSNPKFVAHQLHIFLDENQFTIEENAKAEIAKYLPKELMVSEDDESLKDSLRVDAEIDLDVMLEPRPFQKAGVSYLLKHPKSFLADEMGLGKTGQAISVMHHTQAFPCLIACPASLQINWKREIFKWIGDLTSVSMTPNRDSEWNIIPYTQLKKYKDVIDTIPYKGLVCDESHYLKSGKAQRTKQVKKLAKRIPRVHLLSGTPIVNRPSELISQLEIIGMLEELGGWKNFVSDYCAAYRDKFGLNISGAKNLKTLNTELRKRCYIRRMKKDVLKELPDKQRIIVDVEIADWKEYNKSESIVLAKIEALSEEYEQNAYNVYTVIDEYNLADAKQYVIKELNKPSDDYLLIINNCKSIKELKQKSTELFMRKSDNVVNAQALMLLNELKKVCAQQKMESVLEWVESFMENDQKLVLFADHIEIQKMLINRLAKHKPCSVLGEMQVEERQQNVDLFQNDDSRKIIVCSLQAAGVGLTLTASSNVAFVQCGWTPALHDQAEDRTHRIGQENAVSCFYLLCPKSIDEDIWNIIEEKRKVVNKASDGRFSGKSDIASLVNKVKNRVNQ